MRVQKIGHRALRWPWAKRLESVGESERRRGRRAGRGKSVLTLLDSSWPEQCTLGDDLIADERNPPTVLRPTRHVDRALPAEYAPQNVDLLAFQRQSAKRHVLVLWVAGDAFFIREEYQIPTVGRRVRE